MGLFEKKETADDIKMQLAELSVKLAKVREQVGELDKELTRLNNTCSAHKTQSDELERYAGKALKAGSEQDARTFLSEKYKHDAALKTALLQRDEINATRNKAIELHDKMVRDINDAKTRLAILEARNATAEAQIKASKTVDSFDFEKDLSDLEAKSEAAAAMAEARKYVENGTDDNT